MTTILEVVVKLASKNQIVKESERSYLDRLIYNLKISITECEDKAALVATFVYLIGEDRRLPLHEYRFLENFMKEWINKGCPINENLVVRGNLGKTFFDFRQNTVVNSNPKVVFGRLLGEAMLTANKILLEDGPVMSTGPAGLGVSVDPTTNVAVGNPGNGSAIAGYSETMFKPVINKSRRKKKPK